MVRLALCSFALTIGAVLAAVTLSPTQALAGKGCQRTTFDTKLVADACKKGGQAEAKKVMKTWLKAAKKKEAKLECKSCHSKLAPSYALKPDGVQRFKDLGGQ